MSAAQHVLDQVQSEARLLALAGEPESYAAAVGGELPALPEPPTFAALEAEDDQLRRALAQLDAMIERAARFRLDAELDHAGDGAAIATPTRKVFATTIVSYTNRLSVLAQRAYETAARGGARDAGELAGRVVRVAQGVLALREALRAGVLALVAARAEAAAPLADRRARERTLDEPARQRWSAVRRDLEAIAHQPEAISAAPMATRAAAWPGQLDEPEPIPEPTLAELIELD